jgi:type IV pilus assembly protein PilN
MQFNINLATRTYIDKRLVKQVCYGTIAVLLLLAGWNITRFSWNMGEQRKISAEVLELEKRISSKPAGVSDKDFALQQAQIAFYNQIISQKSKNWLKLLDLIESVTPDGISLSVLNQGKKDDELNLEGHAKSFAVMRKYLEKLEETKAFGSVILHSHQNIVIGEKGRGVSFKISCKVQY